MSKEDSASDPVEPDPTEASGTASDADETNAASPERNSGGEVESSTDATQRVERADTAEQAKASATTEPDESGASKDDGKDRAAEVAGPSLDKNGSNDPDPGAKNKPRSPLVLIGGVAAVLLVVAAVATGFFYFRAQDQQGQLDRRADASKAACAFGHNFATYSGNEVDDYLARLNSTATGEWKKLVGDLGPDLKKRFAESQVNSSASGVQCGYESGSDDKAKIVLVIDQSFTTAGGPESQPGEVKVAANVEMQKVGDKWLVAKFDTPMVQQ